MKLLTTGLIMLMLAMTGCTGETEAPVYYYEIETPMGNMVVRLYNETPQHRDNFDKLVSEKFYDGTLFHRVIPNFMIQGGDPNSKDDDPMNDGMGGPGYTIPAEINPNFFHKKGALAAARQGDSVNPEKASSGSQFYIVQGQVYEGGMLDMLEKQMQQQLGPEFHFSEEALQAYTTVGGTPHLDMNYTVFGEVVEGLDVIDKIAATPTTSAREAPPNRPLSDVSISIRRLQDYSPK